MQTLSAAWSWHTARAAAGGPGMRTSPGPAAGREAGGGGRLSARCGAAAGFSKNSAPPRTQRAWL
ncbi:MAG: hypothetical protein HZB71_06515 [Betaproteobacteria bacterium]|nr:hypothetical protein [Betaproteobacteria bacterium]